MLDVHPPHEAVHGWRDFLIHLGTITIGLLIALSLEGCVEWQHHRHLVHEAEISLHTEIKNNADHIQGMRANVADAQRTLTHDVTVLHYIIANGKPPADGGMSIGFSFTGFGDVSWKTAQTTGALEYMPYATAQEYASLYSLQQQMVAEQEVAGRDAIVSAAPFTSSSATPSKQDAATVLERVGVLQGQLRLLDSLTRALDNEYRDFLKKHP